MKIFILQLDRSLRILGYIYLPTPETKITASRETLIVRSMLFIVSRFN